eukprot:2267905-Amphidinium_carterae.5
MTSLISVGALHAGGEVLIEGSLLNTHEQWQLVDARLTHQVIPYAGGSRFAIACYCPRNAHKLPPRSLKLLRKLYFPVTWWASNDVGSKSFVVDHAPVEQFVENALDVQVVDNAPAEIAVEDARVNLLEGIEADVEHELFPSQAGDGASFGDSLDIGGLQEQAAILRMHLTLGTPTHIPS